LGKTQQGSVRDREFVGETTTAFKSVLFWDKRQSTLDVHLGLNDNVATFYLAPGFQKFGIFCEKAEIDFESSIQNPIEAHDAQVISDDENEDVDVAPKPAPNRSGLWSRLTGLPIRKRQRQEESTPHVQTQTHTSFNLDGPP
jgi:hypothetical protein